MVLVFFIRNVRCY